MDGSNDSLIKFQIGPVQDFIAAARSTRDLWSGSYLLSFLVAAGIRAIPNHETALIFPSPKSDPYSNLFKHSDHLGAVTLIKRVWHLGYLGARPELQSAIGSFKIRSTRAIAARDDRQDDDENTDDAQGEKYLAAIAFDGDSIGKWMGGDNLPPGHALHKHHQDFSTALSDFALNKVREIVEKKGPKDIPLGFLIYAGGDDVVALVPADVALTVAVDLRAAFRKATAHIKDQSGNSPDASVGIAIAHFKSPLQDLIREAQKAEKDAKRDIDKGGQGRSAFSITLLKRSGEISKWGGKWDNGPIALYEAIFKAMENGLSRKFPHRVCQLLETYLTGFSKQTDVPDFPLHEIIEKEFTHAAIRQGSGEIAETLLVPLHAYLENLPPAPSRRHPLLPRRSPHVRLPRRSRRRLAAAYRHQCGTPCGTAPSGH